MTADVVSDCELQIDANGQQHTALLDPLFDCRLPSPDPESLWCSADTLDAMALFSQFFQHHNSSVSERTKEIARGLLEEVVGTVPAAIVERRDVVFESVEMRGYG